MGDGPVTPNLVLGLGTDRIANNEPVTPGAAVLHKGIGDPKIGLVRLEGAWIHGDGYIESAAAEGSSCTITNTAARVDVTFSTADGASARVGVNEDGPPLDREWCGNDCIEDGALGAAVTVDDKRDYWVTKRSEPEMHELTFVATSKGLRIHAMRFSE
ncbi:MAG: hypothetical protein IPH13_19000 [Planctomycetes bacterium]|nr:hypothetical protein [Planctomycetota bacterium]MCC7169613.1 hypothetical protein [Planctomycetota bacterium]